MTTFPAWVHDLKVKDAALYDRAVEFIRTLSREDRIAVLYDDDGDGMSAAASVIIGITRLVGKPPFLVRAFEKTNQYISDDLPSVLRAMQISKLITVDKTVDQKGLAFMQKLEAVCPVLVIDHHKLYQDYQSPRFILAKPQMVWETESSSFPTAIWAYTLFSSVVDLSDKAWIPSIGITSDSAYPRWKSFVDAQVEKYDLPPIPADPFEGPYGIMSRIVYSTQIMASYQLPELLDLLVEAEHPKQILDSGFRSLLKIVDDEVEVWMKRLETEIVAFPEIELYIAKVRPKHGIKSLLINRLSREKYGTKNLLLMQDLGDQRVLISARRQDFKVPMNELMEFAVKGLPESNGGGHIPAAAASIRKVDEPKFLENVKAFLKQYKP